MVDIEKYSLHYDSKFNVGTIDLFEKDGKKHTIDKLSASEFTAICTLLERSNVQFDIAEEVLVTHKVETGTIIV